MLFGAWVGGPRTNENLTQNQKQFKKNGEAIVFCDTKELV